MDVGVGYSLQSMTLPVAVATVYIYPGPKLTSIGSSQDVVADARRQLCADEFARRKAELMSIHPSAQLVQEGDVGPPGGESGIPGSMAVYEMESVFMHVKQPVTSVLFVYCFVGDTWAVQYRFTSPKVVDARGAIAAFMAGLAWTVHR